MVFEIYMYRHVVYGPCYVGQTYQEGGHKTRAGSNGRHYKNLFRRAIQKYGWEKFTCEVLATVEDDGDEADRLEKKYIREYKTHCRLNPHGYNIEWGGRRGAGRVSQESIERMKATKAKKRKALGIVDGETKKCCICKEIRIVAAFGKSKSTWDGYNDTCKVCAAEYYKNNKEKLELYRAEYYKKNSEKLKLQKREYRKNNPEKVKLQKREYRKNNPEKLKLIQAEYYKNNKEKVLQNQAEYYKNNKEKCKQYDKLRNKRPIRRQRLRITRRKSEIKKRHEAGKYGDATTLEEAYAGDETLRKHLEVLNMMLKNKK